MEVEVKIEGFKEIMEQLDIFCSAKVQKKFVQNAVKEGAKPVKIEAERRLGRGKGYIGIGIPKRLGWGADTVASIGIGIKKKHWPLIFEEYGTIERFLTGAKRARMLAKSLGGGKAARRYARQFMFKGARRGRIVAKPFLRPALDSKKNEALDRMRKYLDLALKAIIELKQKMVPGVTEVE